MAAREVIGEFEARRIERMLHELFLGRLRRDERISVSASVEADWLSMRWELADAERKRVYPVEARVDLKREKLRERQAVDLLLDLLGERFDEHLREDRDPFTGPDWEEIDFTGRRVFLRGQICAEAVEVRATALLEADALNRSRPQGPLSSSEEPVG